MSGGTFVMVVGISVARVDVQHRRLGIEAEESQAKKDRDRPHRDQVYRETRQRSLASQQRQRRSKPIIVKTMWFEAIAAVAAVVAGALAAVTGFGIGSLLTPVLAMQVDTRLAVAAVSIPHVLGTALRFWLLKGGVDRSVLWSFGLTSAVGGLAGAALQGWLGNRWLDVVFGTLLLFAAGSQATGLSRRMRFRGVVAWLAGALSGLLGGLVGNQGGIRSAALLGFDLPKHTFIATATAIGLFVDGARMPVYLVTQGTEIVSVWRWVALASVGVCLGTLLGSRTLARIPDAWFGRMLAVVLALLGAVMIFRGIQP